MLPFTYISEMRSGSSCVAPIAGIDKINFLNRALCRIVTS
jgi:hypothetical protein